MSFGSGCQQAGGPEAGQQGVELGENILLTGGISYRAGRGHRTGRSGGAGRALGTLGTSGTGRACSAGCAGRTLDTLGTFGAGRARSAVNIYTT